MPRIIKATPLRGMPLRPTLKDVARYAGVARSTASAILAERPSCYASQETRSRVFAVAAQLNYQPNALSRGLRGQPTNVLGLILRSLGGPTIKAANMSAIEALCAQRGYRLLVGSHEKNDARETQLLRAFLSQQIDGLIVEPGFSGANDSIYESIIESRMPLLAIDPNRPINAAQVSIDRQAGAVLQVQHLVSLGRRRFAFLIESPETIFGASKRDGYLQALRQAGLEPKDQIWLTPSSFNDFTFTSDEPLSSTRPIERILQQGETFDAVVATSDSVALGAMRALHHAGRQVPHDVAVIGFHDETFSASLPISLSTIRHPPDVDRLIFDLLMEQLDRPRGQDEQPDATPSPQRVVCTPTLVVRESSGAMSGR